MKRVAAVLLALGLSLSAGATTMKRYSLLEVRDAAETVFIGEAVSMSTRLVANGKIVATDYVINVREVLSGNVGSTTTVTFIGGKHGEREMYAAGSPSLEPGQTYVFFRTRQPNNTTVGWSQGLFRVETARVNGVNRPVLISAEGLQLNLEGGTLALGSKVNVVGNELRKVAAHQHDLDAPTPLGTPTNADGTPARRVKPVAPNAVSIETPASLDDLRAFVRGGIRK
ncbi:MAG TPA: hypothetical protein VGF48_01550 [Thermoanaerobaculia bacterium]|jgi:hypothetical protein